MFVPKGNFVLVKPDKNLTHYKLAGGKELFARTDLNRQNFLSVTGTVLAVPDELIYNGHKTNAIKKVYPKFSHNKFIVSKLQRLNQFSTSFDVDMELQPNDRVYFHYIMHEECKEDGRIVEIDGESCYFIPYDQLFCAKRAGDVIMLNGYILVEPIGYQEHELFTASGIKFKLNDGENKPGYGKVRHVGSKCRGYLGYREWFADTVDLNPGDYILFKKNSDVPLEWKYLETFDGQQEFFQMQRRDIYAVVKKESISLNT